LENKNNISLIKLLLINNKEKEKASLYTFFFKKEKAQTYSPLYHFI
jgi:hypothetical protein